MHTSSPWTTSYLKAYKTFHRHIEHIYKYTIDSTSLYSKNPHYLLITSTLYRYHKLITAAKKYYFPLIHSSSSNPEHFWRAANSVLHQKSPSPLPSSIPSPPSLIH